MHAVAPATTKSHQISDYQNKKASQQAKPTADLKESERPEWKSAPNQNVLASHTWQVIDLWTLIIRLNSYLLKESQLTNLMIYKQCWSSTYFNIQGSSRLLPTASAQPYHDHLFVIVFNEKLIYVFKLLAYNFEWYCLSAEWWLDQTLTEWSLENKKTWNCWVCPRMTETAQAWIRSSCTQCISVQDMSLINMQPSHTHTHTCTHTFLWECTQTETHTHTCRERERE